MKEDEKYKEQRDNNIFKLYKAILSIINKYRHHQTRVSVIDNMMDPMSLSNSQGKQFTQLGQRKCGTQHFT